MNDLHNRLNGHTNGHTEPPPKLVAAPPPKDDKLRSRLLSLALQLEPIADEEDPIIVVFRSGAAMVRFSFERTTDVVPARLPPIERRCLEVATAKAMKPAAFARLAGYAEGSHVRQALTALVRKGLLAKAVGGGYNLP
jgi:hypothetical protein